MLPEWAIAYLTAEQAAIYGLAGIAQAGIDVYPEYANINLYQDDFMMQLNKTLSAWGTPDFAATLKQEIERLGSDQLPLQQGLSVGSYALDEPVTARILNITELEHVIRVRAGIFFSSVIAGCSCADDPTPVDKIDEYCEVQLDIDKATASTTVALAPGQSS